MTSGTRLSATVKGDLGFAELSLTASYFDRRIDYEFDDTNYAQWRTVNFGTYYALYDTGTLHAVTFNYQKQDRWAYEARLTSQGDGKLSWMAGAFYEDVYDWWEYGDKVPGLTRHAGRGPRRTSAPATIGDPISRPARWSRRRSTITTTTATR